MKKNGIHTEFHENGKKKSDGTYKDGKSDGLYTEWYENGKKEGKGNIKDGKLDGLWTFWYGNGQKTVEGTYKDGEILDGKIVFFNEDGKKINKDINVKITKNGYVIPLSPFSRKIEINKKHKNIIIFFLISSNLYINFLSYIHLIIFFALLI